MKITILPLLLAASALIAPAYASAAGTLSPARTAASEPVNFDGAAARPEKDFVRPDAMTDRRAPDQIAREEQLKADARVERAQPAPAAELGVAAAAPAQGMPNDRLIGGLMGATCGLLGGGLLAYGLSRLTA